MKLSVVASVLACLIAAVSAVPELEDGSGSGQQSITAFPETDDSNSFWLVRAGLGKQCKRGEPVPCGSVIRLRHANTKAYLHSHNHPSPLSRQQEVSCYDGEDNGDDWKIECASGKHWLRETPVQLIHVESKAYLTSGTNHQYGQPIPGQLEVAGAKTSSKATQWMAQEGIYFAEST
ncbi:MIR motif-containing protein [Fennellomyces sp. T-0311]|nr:MIR motif-containing protein [Fennellomyces sp. T-0311]